MAIEQLPTVNVDSRRLSSSEPWAEGQKATDGLLRRHPGLTALLGMDEYLSLGAYRSMVAKGLRPGRDISLCTIGDLDAFGMVPEGVTAVRIPHEEMAAAAALRLFQMIHAPAGGTVPPAEVLRPVLIQRASICDIEVS